MKHQLLYLLFIFGFYTVANAQYENPETPLQHYIPDFVVVSKDNIAYYEEAFFDEPAIKPEALQTSLSDLIKENPELSRSVKNGTGKITTYTEGNYRIETPYVKNKISGLRVITDNRNGYLAMEIPYTNGAINGVVKEYIGKGVLYSETNYKNGIRNGIKTVHYTIKHSSRDSFVVAGNYVNGSLENQLTIHTQGLKIVYPGDFKKGKVAVYNGSFLWLSYTIAGNGYKEGKFEMNGITADTKVKYSSIIAHFNSDKLDGTVEKYDTKGKLVERNEFKNGNPVGNFQNYDRNGNLKFKAEYDQEGRRNGWTTFYTEDGRIYQTIAYKNDEKDGVQTTYANDQIKTIAPYKNGNLHGQSVHFGKAGDTTALADYEEGKLIQEMSFFKSGKTKLISIPQKSYTYFDKNGNKIWTNNYEGEQAIGTIKNINYNQEEDYFVYMIIQHDKDGKKSLETNYYANGGYEQVPWQGYYKHGIGETKSKEGKMEATYYYKGRKLSKEEYEKGIKEDSLKK